MNQEDLQIYQYHTPRSEKRESHFTVYEGDSLETPVLNMSNSNGTVKESSGNNLLTLLELVSLKKMKGKRLF
jgi:hypothetical protein